MKAQRGAPGGKGGPAIAYVNARLLDPASGLDSLGGVVVSDGTIADLGHHLSRASALGTQGIEAFDCKGACLAPGLVDMRTKMERYFQKNLTYNNPAEPACAVDSAVAPLPTDPNFTFACPTLSATQFTITATGIGSMLGFQYSIDQNNNRFTSSVPEGWAGAGSACWVIRQDGSC